jgi:hypothetical protein
MTRLRAPIVMCCSGKKGRRRNVVSGAIRAAELAANVDPPG